MQCVAIVIGIYMCALHSLVSFPGGMKGHLCHFRGHLYFRVGSNSEHLRLVTASILDNAATDICCFAVFLFLHYNSRDYHTFMYMSVCYPQHFVHCM